MEHVLIVDDNPEVCSLVAGFLKRSGLEVSTAANTRDAMRAAAERPPDVVVCDWLLEGPGTGLDLVQALRERSEVGALFITGMGAHGVADSIAPLGMGAEDVLCKPFTGVELLMRLRERFG